MIPDAYITAWRAVAPWASDQQVEHDLVLTRALLQLFSTSYLRDRFLLRGGTALNKLHIAEPVRYSEDIDLVQLAQEPIGGSLDRIHEILDPWLGEPDYDQKHRSITLKYDYEAENTGRTQRLKVEINTREHFAIESVQERELSVDNPWFSGQEKIPTFTLNELMGKKLRALYQRNKGRDLFDLWFVHNNRDISPERVCELFLEYMQHQDLDISGNVYEDNMLEKKKDRHFRNDVKQLLRPGVTYDVEEAFAILLNEYVPHLPAKRHF